MRLNQTLNARINRLYQVIVRDSADWDESKHPRKKNGQFGKGGSQSAMKSVKANIKRGRERMTLAILTKADVKRGMYHNEFGWVDFVWGDDGLTKPFGRNGEPAGRGLAHIFEARERKDGQDYQQTSKMLVNDIVNTIAKGQITSRTSSRIVLEYKANPNELGHKAILTKDKGYNSNAWVLTAFENDPRKGRKANSKDETKMGYDKLNSTHITATRSRDNVGASEMLGFCQDDGQRVGFDTAEPTHFKSTLTRQEMGASYRQSITQNFSLCQRIDDLYRQYKEKERWA